MKKSLIFFIIIFSIMICAVFISAAELTGEVVTGKLSSQTLALNITVTLPVPVISILSPENKTYLTNESLLLNYSQVNADMVWYKVDSGENTTITGEIYFNVSGGFHTLYLYANNSYGSTSENVSFIANSSYLIILYSEYNGSVKGSSTNFISYTYEDLQNLSNIILEHTNYGKIYFNSAINVTNDSIPDDWIVDLDINTNISLNRIELNSTALLNFNKSATLWLYNLPFSNPRILKDGSLCPSSICTYESYTGNILKFNVTGFSVYSAEETPAEEVAPTGRGGGGAPATRIEGFTFDKEFIKIQSKTGETIEIALEIKNPTETTINFNISSNLGNILDIKEKIFTLNPGENKTLSLTFSSTADTTPGVYTGELIIKGNLITKKIPIIFEIESKGIIFDVSLHIPPEYKELTAGEELLAELTLFKIGEVEKANVSMKLIIKDFNGHEIITKEEIVTVENQLSISRNMTLPKSMKAGDYVLVAEVSHSEKIGTSSETFKVVEGFFKKNKLIWISLVILIILIIVIILEDKRIKEIGSYKKIFAEKIRKTYEEEARRRQASKLNMEIEALRRAYKEGHITKASYDKGISRLREGLKK